jgi:hypothetical protein
MRLAADLLPYERMREEMIMGKHGDPEDGKIRERNEATKEWIK